jgi:UDP-glucose 4-epimerase
MTAMACVHYAGSASQARNVPVPVEIRMGAVLECGAFVDGRDVAAAVGRALTVPLAGHHRALLCAPGLAGTAPSLELAARLAPRVPVTGPGRDRADPWAALIDGTAAATTLGCQPARHWSQHGTDTGSQPQQPTRQKRASYQGHAENAS